MSSPVTGATHALEPPAPSPQQALAAGSCCLARRAQESRVCSPESCTSAWCMRTSPTEHTPATGAPLPARTCQRVASWRPWRCLLLMLRRVPCGDAQVRRLLLRRREPPRPRRVRARPLEPPPPSPPGVRGDAAEMPRRLRAAGTAAPRVAAPRAARLGLQLLGRRGFCYGYDDVIVASVSTGCWDQTRRWSGPSCMRERVGGWRRRVCLCPGRCVTSSMCVKLILGAR